MTIKPIAGFQSLSTHHCVSGSLRQVYSFNGSDISEDMLLGLGEGVSYIYWHQKGQLPVLAGRGAPKPSLEEVTGKRTGVRITSHKTSSARKAEKALVALLEAGQPVMINVDMGFLPYLDFGGEEYHFGGHLVTACGYDRKSKSVLLADRDLALHEVPMDILAKARGSKHKPMPPQNRRLTADFTHLHQPTASDIRQAIGNQAALMLDPPISNIGVKGILKSSKAVPQWSQSMSGKTLRAALFNAHIFINHEGGTGGGLFRYMFARFLHEASRITAVSELAECGAGFKALGDEWDALGYFFRDLSESPHPVKDLGVVEPRLRSLADREEEQWTNLQAVLATMKDRPPM